MCLKKLINEPDVFVLDAKDAISSLITDIKYHDAGKVLGFVGDKAERGIKKIKDIKKNGISLDEDTELFIKSKLRLVSDFAQYPVNMVREAIGL